VEAGLIWHAAGRSPELAVATNNGAGGGSDQAARSSARDQGEMGIRECATSSGRRFKAAGSFPPPCSQAAPAYGVAGRYAMARRRTARGAGASGRAASGRVASGGSTSGRVLAVRRGAPAHDVVVRRRPAGKILQCPCLNASNSKKLNRSVHNNE
jgi:hypothetical protein